MSYVSVRSSVICHMYVIHHPTERHYDMAYVNLKSSFYQTSQRLYDVCTGVQLLESDRSIQYSYAIDVMMS